MHAIKRVVFYARDSTDQQNPASIETQIDLGKEFVERQGWRLIDIFVDAGVSGSSFETRPGLQSAVAGSNSGAYDIFLYLTLDRLSRDLEHGARALKLLQFRDVELWTVPTVRRLYLRWSWGSERNSIRKYSNRSVTEPARA